MSQSPINICQKLKLKFPALFNVLFELTLQLEVKFIFKELALKIWTWKMIVVSHSPILTLRADS